MGRKISQKERELLRIKQELGIENKRGDTFVGFRPSVMESKKNNKKLLRKEGKRACRDAMMR